MRFNLSNLVMLWNNNNLDYPEIRRMAVERGPGEGWIATG